MQPVKAHSACLNLIQIPKEYHPFQIISGFWLNLKALSVFKTKDKPSDNLFKKKSMLKIDFV